MSNEQNQESDLSRDIREIRTCITAIDAKVADIKQSMQQEIHAIRVELLQFQMRAAQLDDVSSWSSRFREQITLTDLEKMREDVQGLKEYRTKAAVTFTVIQFIVGIGVAWFTKG